MSPTPAQLEAAAELEQLAEQLEVQLYRAACAVELLALTTLWKMSLKTSPSTDTLRPRIEHLVDLCRQP